MSLPADGVNANTLAETTTIPTGKKLIFLDPDTNEGGIITLENLTKQILSNLTSQTFNLDQGNKTLLAALNELNSKTKISVIAPEAFESGEETRSYKLSPLVLDQSILCICRSEIYLLTLAQSTTIFNGCYMNKVFDAVSVRDASVKLTENRKDIIFTCATFENPVFIGKF